MKTKITLFSLIIFFTCISCNKEEIINELSDIDISQSSNGIVEVPKKTKDVLKGYFTKYTYVKAQNGRPIHIFAQSLVDDEKIIRARNILKMYITDLSNSEYGNTKFFIGNSMADRNAALFFFNSQKSYEDSISDLRFVPFNYQDLYGTESILEGSPIYIDNNTRDASYEEILHLVQDYGISPTLPLFQEELDNATEEAVRNNVYNPPSELPKADHDQEYFASIWDSYLGAWEHSNNPEYKYNSRESLKKYDPKGYQIIKRFLPNHLLYNARIWKEFKGVFYMEKDDKLSYTFKSQYLKDATLTGDLNSGLSGNYRDNTLTGNSGNNMLYGLSGNDNINGKEGIDFACYRGNKNEYNIVSKGEITTITDKTSNRDGIDTLINIEYIQFKNAIIKL
ncbi:hypothetical protein E0494_07105 [Marinilabiliaceae bacterium JC040]|nr:hypothetical protein [Marinilabiliaceae bacterium JC040]